MTEPSLTSTSTPRRGRSRGRGRRLQPYAWLGAGVLTLGFGAAMARGCTSGQALSGGAVLSVGSWAFMMMVFAGGYLLAYPLRRLWL